MHLKLNQLKKYNINNHNIYIYISYTHLKKIGQVDVQLQPIFFVNGVILQSLNKENDNINYLNHIMKKKFKYIQVIIFIFIVFESVAR